MQRTLPAWDSLPPQQDGPSLQYPPQQLPEQQPQQPFQHPSQHLPDLLPAAGGLQDPPQQPSLRGGLDEFPLSQDIMDQGGPARSPQPPFNDTTGISPMPLVGPPSGFHHESNSYRHQNWVFISNWPESSPSPCSGNTASVSSTSTIRPSPALQPNLGSNPSQGFSQHTLKESWQQAQRGGCKRTPMSNRAAPNMSSTPAIQPHSSFQNSNFVPYTPGPTAPPAPPATGYANSGSESSHRSGSHTTRFSFRIQATDASGYGSAAAEHGPKTWSQDPYENPSQFLVPVQRR